ncbi:MAG: UBA/THIF-type NAD/FAD binding protein [Magnetococcales bacterium]|nr:UBA/THIF-type NAD/FAD binding protein [Magnetococcales bacterium]
MPNHATLIIGAGGLGSCVAMALGTAGIGRMTLVDPDTVALSNLHRQPLYMEADLGASKVDTATIGLQQTCVNLEIGGMMLELTELDPLVALAREHDYIVDGSDNFATRFLANDAALHANRPLVHGAASGLRGQLMTILPHRSTCLRCLFDAPPDSITPTCQEAGILGPLVMEIGWLMAMEIVKLTEGTSDLLTNRMLTIDLETGIRRHVPLARQSDCRGCSTH